jgi:hypothetical protein
LRARQETIAVEQHEDCSFGDQVSVGTNNILPSVASFSITGNKAS